MLVMLAIVSIIGIEGVASWLVLLVRRSWGTAIVVAIVVSIWRRFCHPTSSIHWLHTHTSTATRIDA